MGVNLEAFRYTIPVHSVILMRKFICLILALSLIPLPASANPALFAPMPMASAPSQWFATLNWQHANNNITSYIYDSFDRLQKTTYPDSSYEFLTYDNNSNLVSKRTRKGDLISYSYDSLNRLTAKIYPDTTAINYSYDIASRLTEVEQSTGAQVHTRTSYAYDALNRVIQTNDQRPATSDRIIGYEYDKAGDRTKLIYSDNTYITYAYDSLNRLTAIKDQAETNIASYDYDILGRRASTNLANNTQTNYSYDNVNRPLNMANKINGGADISTYAYIYDNVGNRLSKTLTTGTENYSYDNIYQLTSVTDPALQVTSYGYDKLGNRNTAEGKTYSSNNLNQYTAVDAANLTYDPNGNLTGNGTWTYSYDYENRLTGATNGTITASYAYDPFGRRISKTVDGVTTNFVYDGDQIIAEYDGSGILQRKYVYGNGIDEPIIMQAGANKYFYNRDGLGSISEITDNTGTVVEKYSYDVYGRTTIKDSNDTVLTQSAIGNRYGFTGRELDYETGLYHYRARAYSPDLGRFLQTDPIGYYGGMNLLAYCRNNPTRFIDPSGKISIIEGVVIVGVAVLAGTIVYHMLKNVMLRVQRLNDIRYQQVENAGKGVVDANLTKEANRLQGQIQVISGVGTASFDAARRATDPVGTVFIDVTGAGKPDLNDLAAEQIKSGLEQLGVPKKEDPNAGNPSVDTGGKCPKNKTNGGANE